jgi:hypothetical protein
MTDAAPEADRQPYNSTATVPDTATGSDRQGAWLTSHAAQQQLGISERTLFRRIARGQLERRHRANGQVEVWVPTAEATTATADSAPDTDRQHAQAEQALVLVDRFGQAVAQQVAPLLQEMAAMRQQLVDQAEEIGRLRAQLDRRAPAPAAPADTDRQTDGHPPWWRRWWPRGMV